tara:strand:+ start:101 stop:1216 length:1116 start_codon:yes stop_codon:yes gene_type:complete
MTTLATLFKKTKTGAVQQWEVRTYNNNVITHYGQVDGAVQTEEYETVAKNVGRSNEVSPEKQAMLEAAAKHTKQKDKGYVEDPSGESGLTLPPLAYKYQDKAKSVKWPQYVSTKYDGLRCTIFYKDNVVLFQSRGGKAYPVIHHIAEELQEELFNFCPNAILDGELFVDGMHLDDIGKAVKTTKHPEMRSHVKLYVFDFLSCKYDESTLHDRLSKLPNLLGHLVHTKVVKQQLVHEEKHMLALHSSAVHAGMEGVVIRDPSSVFKWGQRTSEFLKYKLALDAEYKVVGMEQNKQGGGVLVCEYTTKQGLISTFKCNMKCSKEEKVKLWEGQDEIIGKWLTVEYEKLSNTNACPAKPIGKCFREMRDGEVVE